MVTLFKRNTRVTEYRIDALKENDL